MVKRYLKIPISNYFVTKYDIYLLYTYLAWERIRTTLFLPTFFIIPLPGRLVGYLLVGQEIYK